MAKAYINRVAIAAPEHETRGIFFQVTEELLRDRRSRMLFLAP